MTRHFALGLAALASLASPIPLAAQQQTPQQPQAPQVVTRFDDQTLRFLLQDIQATWRYEQVSDGSTVYRASAEGDINFTLAPRACSPEGGCTGLMVIALFQGVNAPSAAQLDAFINQFNDLHPTAKVLRSPEGTVALQTYVNAAYGVSYRNVQEQFLVFGQNISILSQALTRFEQGG